LIAKKQFGCILVLAELRGGQTMLIDMNELPPTLRAHITVLRGLVHSALTDFTTLQEGLRNRYSARTEASIIHDYMVYHAKVAGYPWKVRRNLFLFRIGNDYLTKPKKLDRSWRTRNIRTQLVLRFEGQRALKLFDDLDLTHLYLGYQREGAELVTSSIWLVCPDGKGIKWAAELRADDAEMSIEIAAPATIPDEPTGKRVSAKKTTEPQTKTKGE
jgi:hypothetical protein